MLNLVNQNKQQAKEAHCDEYVMKFYFCYISRGYIISHQPFWIHEKLYFHKIYKIIIGTQQHLSAKDWNNIQHSVSLVRDIKNGVSTSYFVKIKNFRLQTSKLLRNKRKTYILDVICNRFYFGEVQEEVLDQCCGQGISALRVEGLSVYQWSVPEKKTSRLVEKMPL